MAKQNLNSTKTCILVTKKQEFLFQISSVRMKQILLVLLTNMLSGALHGAELYH